MNPKIDCLLEAYLDQVLAPLTRSLSSFHRDELRRELRAHLWERIDAYRELEHSEEEAVTEALQQFGGAEDFARQWRQEWLTVSRVGAGREIAAATWPALRLCVPLLVGAWATGRLLGSVVVNALPSAYFSAILIAYSDAFWWTICGSFFCLSLGAGLAQGRSAPRRSRIGMFAALSIVVVAGSGLDWVSTKTGLDRTLLGGLFTSLPLMAAAWLPTACLSAALTGWGMRRSKLRRLA
ncbi:MAG: permease prefix domain 1-containing protein [Janthinobacterium lividum]